MYQRRHSDTASLATGRGSSPNPCSLHMTMGDMYRVFGIEEGQVKCTSPLSVELPVVSSSSCACAWAVSRDSW